MIPKSGNRFSEKIMLNQEASELELAFDPRHLGPRQVEPPEQRKVVLDELAEGALPVVGAVRSLTEA